MERTTEKPFDLDRFFKEQDERMNLSDSDWEEYEERRYQERKRKREVQSPAAEDVSVLLPLPDPSQIGREAEAALKRRKLTEKKIESIELIKEPEVIHKDRRQQVVSGAIQDILPSPSAETGPVSSQQEVTKSSSKTLNLPCEDLSNITTPQSTTGSTSPKQLLPNVKLAKTITEAAPVLKRSTAPMENRNKPTTTSGSRLVKTVSASLFYNRRRNTKKAPDDSESLMTPMEYAGILHDKWQCKVSNTPPEQLFLKDCTIFMVFEEKSKSTKDTRIKLDILARNGGQVATSYDPEKITHIIPGGSTVSKKKILRALQIKSVEDIPAHIHTVSWDWIVSGLTNKLRVSEVMYELYKERLVFYAGGRTSNNKPGLTSHSNNKGKGKELEIINPAVDDFSVIGDFSLGDSTGKKNNKERDYDLRTSSGSSKAQVINSEREDPLLPYYAQAREEAKNASDDDDYSPSFANDTRTSKLKGFQCDTKNGAILSQSPNWDVIEKLAELREMHRELGTEGDKWRVLSYQKAIGSLKTHPTRIKSKEEAMELRGVSSKTADKIMEIVQTGELQRIKFTKTPELDGIRIFRGIYGVGSNIARKWIAQGYKNIDDLEAAVAAGNIKLTHAQGIGLRHYEDINDRMPRQEAAEIFIQIKDIAMKLDPKLSLEIMGSFRRGKSTCGDIDILLTRPTDDGQTHAGTLKSLYNLLKKRGILCEDLALPDDWGALEITYRGLCRKDESSRRRRIDILCIPYESRGAARIYYTGDDIFNRSIRLKANKMGLSLNQRGLFQGVVRDERDRTNKLHPGSVLCSDSERRIFEILGVPWQEPHERVRS